MKRAIMVLGNVGATYYAFADSQLLVTPAHVQALKDADIPYEQLS